jgi:hypothetical protein
MFDKEMVAYSRKKIYLAGLGGRYLAFSGRDF